MSEPERWSVTVDGRRHVVAIGAAGLGQAVSWSVDGTTVASRRTSDERLVLTAPEAGAVSVVLARWSPSARRVRWHGPDAPGGAEAAAHVGLGGTDLTPADGTRAARRQRRMVAHPRRYVAIRTLGAVAGVVLPIVLTLLAIRLAVHVPWPSIPWPDWRLPTVPWPDVSWPDVPWPDWELPSLPAWLKEALGYAKYVVPVVVAFLVARSEVKRRLRQDQAPVSGRSLQDSDPAERRRRPEADVPAGSDQKRAGGGGEGDESHTGQDLPGR